MEVSSPGALIRESDYTDVLSQALQLKRSIRELQEAKQTHDELRKRIAATERVSQEMSTQHAVDMARVERQRDEFRDLLRDKTNELAVASQRLQSLQDDLKSARDTIAHMQSETALKNSHPCHVQVRHDNFYDALFAEAVKSLGSELNLVDRYRNIETHTSNMTWQSFVEESMSNLVDTLFELRLFHFTLGNKDMAKRIVERKSLQPPFFRVVQRRLEYEDAKKKKMTKKQLAVFEDDKRSAEEALVEAWLTQTNNAKD